jgi:hypothetical protein
MHGAMMQAMHSLYVSALFGHDLLVLDCVVTSSRGLAVMRRSLSHERCHLKQAVDGGHAPRALASLVLMPGRGLASRFPK